MDSLSRPMAIPIANNKNSNNPHHGGTSRSNSIASIATHLTSNIAPKHSSNNTNNTHSSTSHNTFAAFNSLAGVAVPNIVSISPGSAAASPMAATTIPANGPPTAAAAAAAAAASAPTPHPARTLQPSSSILLNPIVRSSPQPQLPTLAAKSSSSLADTTPSAELNGDHYDNNDQASTSRLPAPAPVVTHIPAVPSEKEIQRRKEKRARQREERERKEKEAKELELAMELEKKEEKVWGIPKKAFYMGLGSVPGAINFNAQMAMLGGWGNGSGGPTDITTTTPSREVRSNKRPKSSTSQSPSNHHRGSNNDSNTLSRASSGDTIRSNTAATPTQNSLHRRKSADTHRYSSEEEEKLDPEELAALNAIINTRRSMAAAKALASGQVKLPAPKRPVRPELSKSRDPSQESVTGSASTSASSSAKQDNGADAASSPAASTSQIAAASPDASPSPAQVAPPAANANHTSPSPSPHSKTRGSLGEGDASSSRPHLASKASDASSGQLSQTINSNGNGNGNGNGKVHFAPLPRPIGPLSSPSQDPMMGNGMSPPDLVSSDHNPRLLSDTPRSSYDQNRNGSSASLNKGKDSFESERSAFANDSDSDYDSDADTDGDFERFKKRISGSGKNKWYLMGLPSTAFKPEYYRQWKRWSVEAMVSGAPRSTTLVTSTEGDNSLARRTSAGSLGAVSAPECERSNANNGPSNGPCADAASASGVESCASSVRKSRRGRRHSRASMKGSSSVRSPSAGSVFDEEERIRRRQLILASRPGGTGMVTLPDGTKVKARRVGQAGQGEQDELGCEEWGFAGLARQKAEADANDHTSSPPEETSKQDSDQQQQENSQLEQLQSQLTDGGAEQIVTAEPQEMSTGEEGQGPETAAAAIAEEYLSSHQDDGPPIDVEADDRSEHITGRLSALKLSAMHAEEVQRRHEEEMCALSAEVLAAHRRRQEASAAAASIDSPHGSRIVSADSSGHARASSPARNGVPSATTSGDGSKRSTKEKPSFPSLRPTASTQSRHSDKQQSRVSSQTQQPITTTQSHPPSSYPAKMQQQQLPQASTSSLALSSSPSGSPSRLKSNSRSSFSSSIRRFRSPSETRANDSTIALPSPMSSLPRKPDAKGYAVVPLPSELGVRPVRPQEGRVWSWDDEDDSSMSDEEARRGANALDSDSSDEDDDSDEDEDEGVDDEEMAEEDRRTAAMQAKRATTTAAGLERIRSRHGSVGGFGSQSTETPGAGSSTGTNYRSKSQTQRFKESLRGESERGRNPRRRQTADVAVLSSIDSDYQRERESGGQSVPESPTAAAAAVRATDADGNASGQGSKGPSTPRRSRGSSLSSAHPPTLTRGVVDGTHTSGSGEAADTCVPQKKESTSSPLSTSSSTRARLRSATSSPILPRTKKQHKKKSKTNAKKGQGQESTEDDDLEYWPRSASQMFGLASSSGGPMGKKPTAASLLAEATRAKAVRDRWERERLEKERAKKALEEKDDDAMDYGWPPTLKGSLYDR
ncbi:unnamed protein product [Sympodiomycopsis kandeliae]